MDVNYVAHMGDDLMVANAARVSFDKHKETFDEGDEKLLKYLAAHNHWTPYAHPQITLRMKAPIFVRTQCFKHKQGFVENEVSRRYVDDAPEFLIPDEWRGRPTQGAKQGSAGTIDAKWLKIDYQDLLEQVLAIYEDMIEAGVAPEQARMVLPQSMYTSWYWTGSLAAYARFYKQRIDPHAQKEIQDLAKMVGEIIQPIFPVSWKALTESPDQAIQLFERIKHGDEEHQAWLKTELEKYFG